MFREVPTPRLGKKWARSHAALLAVAVAVLVATLAATGSTANAATGDPSSIAVATVGDQAVRDGMVAAPVSGTVPVTGTAAVGSVTAVQAKPLVADAGDSAFVTAGEPAPLLGAGYGGTAPYSFAWTSPLGELAGADAPTAQLTVDEPGRYPASLTITDASGATASDEVIVIVSQTQQRTLLEETKTDATPGVVGTAQYLTFPFSVPDGVSAMTVDLSWGLAANDYDLQVVDPSGAVRASSGNSAGTPEQAGVPNPESGDWTVRAEKWATVTDSVTATVTATLSDPDPRPTVSAGGPYAFGVDATQELQATVEGGGAPVAVAWDLDEDGVFEAKGASVTAGLEEGRHLVTAKATDAEGLERRQTASVLVASPERLAAETTAVTVIGVADTGINPYHLEFSAETYPDPDVLALTDGFTRHPSEYIPGYPADAKALPVTLDQRYFPAADNQLWSGNGTVQPGELYWIPGTKVVGAIDAGGSTGTTSGDDPHPILDDNGHGSGSASVSTGNRYGYCPTCLLVVVEALDETVVAGLPWVDISSNSFGYVGGLPLGPLIGPSQETKAAAERGQTTLFAAGNGVGNAFDVPISTYGSDQTGPDWNVTVGALRRDNQRAVVGDGIPVHLSSWGDGNLPSACRTGTVGQCAFGGTSAATPYTAGVFGTVLGEVRQALGDGAAGQRPGQVVAKGLPLDASVYLADGELTRAELREAVVKTAQPLNQENELSPYPYPLTAPYTDANVLFEGYGAATPESARRAADVLLGRAQLPERPLEDDFFALDRQVRDSIYGGYDRDGDGETDSEALAGGLGLPLQGVTDASSALAALAEVAEASAPPVTQVTGESAMRYYLHRSYAGDPGTTAACSATSNEQSMSRENVAGDLEPCFESRVTSVVAAFRPLGIFASSDLLEAPVPAGSTVTVELYIAGETPSAIRPTGVLMAGDREIGRGEGALQPVAGSGPSGALCASLGEACWTRFALSFETDRHAFTGEQLTFQVGLLGARSWAFGLEGAHTSSFTITPAELPAADYEFGATITEPASGSEVASGTVVVAGGAYAFPEQGSDPTGAGDHPAVRKVEVSVDDASFGDPIEASLDEGSGTWSAPLGEPREGEHTVYARARVDQRLSEVTSSTFTVAPTEEVQWQVVSRNGSTDATAWRTATGVSEWSYSLDTAQFGTGNKMIVTRLVEDGAETARATVRARFR